MLMTKEGYEKKVQEIRNLEAEKYEVGRSDKSVVRFDNHVNSVDHNEETILASRIRTEKNELENARIVTDADIVEGTVNLGDHVTLLIKYHDGEIVEETYTLTDGSETSEEDIATSITISSSIGNAIYHHKVGDVVAAKTPDGLCTISISEISRGLKR